MDSICSPEMPRRAFMATIASGLLAAPLAAEAQPAGKVPRIGVLSPGSPSGAGRNPSDLAVLFAAFRESLRELGYVEGQNIKLESRWAEGNYDRFPTSRPTWSVSRWTSS